MTNNLKSTKFRWLVVLATFMLVAVITAMIFYQQPDRKKAPASSNTETPARSTKNWEIYTDTAHGLQLKYPTHYKENSLYNIWQTTNESIYLQQEWGINKGQETILAISIYPAEQEKFVLEHFGYQLSGKTVPLANQLAAEQLSPEKLLIRQNGYLYIIYSSFASAPDTTEYQEYTAILENLQID